MGLICEICGKNISTRRHLEEHYRRHRQENPYSCEICGKTFPDTSNLSKHRQTHTGIEKYECQRCHRKFKSTALLSAHNKNFTSPLEHRCTHCCSSFSKEGNWKSHILKYHPEEDNIKMASSKSNRRKEDYEIEQYGSGDEDVTVVGATQADPEQTKLGDSNSRSRSSTSGQRRKLVKFQDVADAKKRKVGEQEKQDDDDGVDFMYATQKNAESTEHDEQEALEDSQESGDNNPDEDGADNLPSPTGPLSFAINEEALGQHPEANDSPQPIMADEEAFYKFSIKTWRLSTSDDILQHLQQAWKNDSCNHHLRLFLCGKKSTPTVEEMTQVLKSDPEQIVGNFVVSMMLVDFVVNLSLADIIKFVTSLEGVDSNFRSVIQNTGILTIQQQLRMNFSSGVSLDCIPTDIRSKLSSDSFYLQDILNGRETTFQIEQETKCMDQIFSYLVMSIQKDLGPLTTLDTTFAYQERSLTWTSLATNYMREIRRKNPVSPFEVLLQSDLNRSQGVEVCFRVKSGHCETPVSLHKFLLARLTNSSTVDTDLIATASPSDVQIFKSLIYKSFDPNDYIGKVTFSLFKLAQQVKIANIWDFLFRQFPYDHFMDDYNKVDLFHIVISLRKKEQVKLIASNFKMWFNSADVVKCLNGLSAEDVLFFLGQDALNIDQLTVYRILVQWSFSQCGKECSNELTETCDDATGTVFQTVSHVLRLQELRPHFSKLYKQKFISATDIDKSNSCTLSKLGFDCRL